MLRAWFEKPFYLFILLFFLLLKLALLFFLQTQLKVGLAPDEAQYWLWSHHLDWGYYSKPPGIAYQIALSTSLFGEQEWGVRALSNIISLIFSISLYRLCWWNCRSYTLSILAALSFAFCPIGVLGALAATTDVGSTFFFTLALCAAVFSFEDIRWRKLYTTALILGSLFKWSVFLCVIPYLGFSLCKGRSFFWRSLLASLFGLAGLLPSMFWNLTHRFATFKHVYTQSSGGSHAHDGNPVAFFLGQAAFLGPVFYALFIVALFYIVRLWKQLDLKDKMAFSSIYGIYALFLTLSFFSKVQINWGLFIYPAFFIFIFPFVLERLKAFSKKIWLRLGNLLNVLLLIAAFSIPLLQAMSAPIVKVPFSLSPFRQNMGWDQLENILSQAAYEKQKHFLFSHKYQISSELSYYVPVKEKAYFFNIKEARRNQFDFWPQMKDREIGRDGFFVYVDNEPNFSKQLNVNTKEFIQILETYFERVEPVFEGPLYKANGEPAKGVFILKCFNYNGKEPNLLKESW